MLTEQGIKRYIKSPIDVIFFEESPSTNLEAKSIAATAREGTVIFARRQLSGRGRMGRSFESPEGGIYMTMLVRPTDPVCLTMAAAVAVRRAMVDKLNLDPAIKWVNDIFVRGKKVCGILCESAFGADALSEYVVIGAGVNITEPLGGFPADISAVAGALLPHGSGQELRSRLAAAFLEDLFGEYARLDSRSFLDEYRRRSMVTGKNVSVISPTLTRHGKAIAIDDDCRLVVRFDDGTTEHVSTGEISVRVD